MTEPLDVLRALMRQASFGRDRSDAVLRDQALHDGVTAVHALPSETLDALVRKKPGKNAG